MKLRVILLLLAFALRSIAATGDIGSITIESNGWELSATTEGFVPGATYDFDYRGYIIGSAATGSASVGETMTQATSGATVVTTSATLVIAGVYYIQVQDLAGTPDKTNVWSVTGGSGATITPTNTPSLTIPGPGTPYLTVVSEGYTGDTLGTRSFTIYLSRVIRKVYPNDGDLNEAASGGNLVTRFVLSDYVYVDDNTGAGKSGTAPVITAPAGFITNTAGASQTSNALANDVVSNNSAAPYPKTVNNWAGGVEYQRIEDDTVTLRVLAFQRHGMNGSPMAAVKGTVFDGTNTATATVTSMSQPDLTQGDARATSEYLIPVSLSTITQGATCTANFTAYPWRGDASVVVSSSAGAAAPSPLVGPITFVCDKSGTYKRTFVTVDDDAADDTSGVAVDRADYASNTLAEAGAVDSKTIAKAASLAVAYNLATHGRNDAGAAEVCLAAGTYAWLGADHSYGTTPACRIIIRPKTGVAKENVIIATASGDGDISDRIEIRDCTITVSTNNTFTNINEILFKRCTINSSGIGLFNTTAGIFSFEQCDIDRLDQGIQGPGTNNCSPKLLRGCTLDGFGKNILAYTVIGNRGTGMAGAYITDHVLGMTGPAPRAIIYNNEFLGCTSASAETVRIGKNQANTDGMAFVQNVVEVITSSPSAAGIADFGTSAFSHYYYILWNNIMVGDRAFHGYDQQAVGSYARYYWSEVGNVWSRWSHKADNEGVQPLDGWSIKFGVGTKADFKLESHYSLPTSFYAEWDGLYGYEPYAGSYGLYTDTMFTDYQAATPSGLNGATAGTGGGDYHPLAGSPLGILGMPSSAFVLAYDGDGKPWTASNFAAGAYSLPGVVHSNKGLKLFIRRR
jgi:hypothetical protein